MSWRQVCDLAYTLILEERLALAAEDRHAAVIAASVGVKPDAMPWPDEVRERLEAELRNEPDKAIAPAGHDAELYAALGIGGRS